MTGRRQVLVEGAPTEVMTDLVAFLRTTGCSTFELKYTVVVNGQDTGLDKPGPADSVRWTAVVGYPRRGKVPAHESSADHLAGPGARPDLGMVHAAVRLVEKLGGNVVLVDMSGPGVSS